MEANMDSVMARLEALEKENTQLKQSGGFGFSAPHVTYGEYKGKQTIIINGAGKPLSFGRTKAKAIVACFDEIKRFAEEAGER